MIFATPQKTEKWNMSGSCEIYAIRYANHSGRRIDDNFLGSPDPHEQAADLDFFVWLIRGKAGDILVDTGFNETTAAARNRKLIIHPVDALKKFGVVAEPVVAESWDD